MPKKISEKNILFVSSAPHVAGGEINLLALLDSIDTARFTPYCLYNPLSHFETFPLRKDVNLFPFQFPIYARKNLVHVASTILRLFVVLKKHSIDLIYLNSVGTYKFFLPLSMAMKIPVILHIHIDETDDSMKWIKANSADRILFPSKATMSTVLEHSPWIDPSKCFYVHNAVDISKYYPHATEHLKTGLFINDNLPVLGVIGQLKKIKGQRLFLEMLKKLSQEGFHAHYIIVGDDNIQQGRYEAFLKRKSAELGIKDKVMFLGYRTDIPEIMSLCDLVVVPSLKEPFGRVVIEAMACATPVVASAVDGIVEIFKDGEGGLFFKPGSVDDLTAKVKYFFNHPNWWEQQKKKAVEICRENFRQEIHTRKIEEHITACLSSI